MPNQPRYDNKPSLITAFAVHLMDNKQPISFSMKTGKDLMDAQADQIYLLGGMPHLLSSGVVHITKTRQCNIQQYFTAVKMLFSDSFFKIFFLFFAQNIDCGYSLEPPQ